MLNRVIVQTWFDVVVMRRCFRATGRRHGRDTSSEGIFKTKKLVPLALLT